MVIKPRRLKIVEPNFTDYNGHLGITAFTNGVSDEKVGHFEALRLGAIMRIVDADDEGHDVNPSAEGVRARAMTADDAAVERYNTAAVVDNQVCSLVQRMTREELEAVASKEGLAGVREIARKWQRTGRSIDQCIEAVLEAQDQVMGDKTSASLPIEGAN